ncbi:MAG: hypothetical protein J6V59_01710 [Alistipes sp.]|nr:hypothetical protein [Alistipes sp.]
MKKYFAYIAVVVVALLVGVFYVSCSDSANSISQRTIVNQVNESLENQAVNVVYLPLEIGTFECDYEDYRLCLRKLENAGLLDYDITRYAWWEKEERSVRESYSVWRESYWYGGYYDTEYRWVNKTFYNFEDHYVVTATLTKSGQKICVDELPKPIEQVDEDLEQPEINPEDYSWNKDDLSESWPEIHNPFIERSAETDEDDEVVICEEEADYDDGEYEDVEEVDDNIDRNDEEQFLKYHAVNIDQQSVYIKAYELEAVKARNIQIYEEDGITRARAEVIISTCDVTDAGRIMLECEDDMRSVIEVSLTYYLDKGWVLDDALLSDLH